MTNPNQFTPCPKPPENELLISATVLRSDASTRAFRTRLNRHRTFWNGLFRQANEEELNKRLAGQELTPADIVRKDAKRMAAENFSNELTAVLNDLGNASERPAEQYIPVAGRGISLEGLSVLFRRIIFPESSEEAEIVARAVASPTMPEAELLEGAAAVEANDVFTELLSDEIGRPKEYVLHINPNLISGHFADGGLPALFTPEEDSWRVDRGLYLQCTNPAEAGAQQRREAQEQGIQIDFDHMITLSLHLDNSWQV